MNTTSAREFVGQFVTVRPQDKIVTGHFANCEVIDAADAENEPESNRVARLNRALDARNRELEQELRQKDADYTAIVLEYQDLADENRRLTMELDVKRVAADHREATIKKLRAELDDIRKPSPVGMTSQS